MTRHALRHHATCSCFGLALFAASLIAWGTACGEDGPDLLNEVRPTAAVEISRGPAYEGRQGSGGAIEVVYRMDGSYENVVSHYKQQLTSLGYEFTDYATGTGSFFSNRQSKTCLSLQSWGVGPMQPETMDATRDQVEGHEASFWLTYTPDCEGG